MMMVNDIARQYAAKSSSSDLWTVRLVWRESRRQEAKTGWRHARYTIFLSEHEPCRTSLMMQYTDSACQCNGATDDWCQVRPFHWAVSHSGAWSVCRLWRQSIDIVAQHVIKRLETRSQERLVRRNLRPPHDVVSASAVATRKFRRSCRYYKLDEKRNTRFNMW